MKQSKKCDNCGEHDPSVRAVDNARFNANVCTACEPHKATYRDRDAAYSAIFDGIDRELARLNDVDQGIVIDGVIRALTERRNGGR